MSNILVTGHTGFVGKHLTEYLRKKGENVTTFSRSEIDLTNMKDLHLLKAHEFDKIFHLAAQSSVHISWEKPFETLRYNINSVNNLLETFAGTKTKLIFAGTSEVYKNSDQMLTEESELKSDNLSPYALSKLTTDNLIRSTAKQKNIRCVLLRLFTHTGYGQSINFALSSWAKQLIKIKYNQQENKIFVGNTDIKRDFTDIADVCRSYDLVSNNTEEFGEVYNVCSGNPYLLKDLLNRLIHFVNIDVEVIVSEKLVRKNDIYYLCGNHDKITKAFGWIPKVSIDTALKNLLFYWEQHLCA